MLDRMKFEKFLKDREANEIALECGDLSYWNEFSDFLSANISDTISFLENECTAEEIYWSSEVWDQVAKKTQSKDFVAALHRIYNRMPADVQNSIKHDIEFAKQAIVV